MSVIVLSTDKRIYTNAGIVGIGEELEPHHGYDGSIDVVDWLARRLVLSHIERRELADYAISLWQKFAELTDDELLKPLEGARTRRP